MLVNPERQVWFIPQRHLLAYRLIDSEEFFLPKVEPTRYARAAQPYHGFPTRADSGRKSGAPGTG
jgi:hypothetical protein